MRSVIHQRMSMVVRRAFTLIELLVVIAVIGLLVAILLPAMTSVLEAARAMQCRTNLKQLGVALIAYHTTHDVFPAAADGGDGQSCVYFNSTGYTRLLPYLEQKLLYDQFNFEGNSGFGFGYAWSAPGNSTAIQTPIDTFLCPSNSRPTSTPLQTSGIYAWSIGRAAVTDYLFSGGADRNVSAIYALPEKMGAIGFYSRTRLADIRDGSGNTFLMGEAAGGATRNPLYASDVTSAGTLTDPETGAVYRRVCVPVTKYLSEADGFTVFVDNVMHHGYGRRRAMANWKLNLSSSLVARTADAHGNFYPPNDCAYAISLSMLPGGNEDPNNVPQMRAGHPQDVSNFRSAHRGFTNMLMADGSVLSVTDGVDGSIFMAQSTIAGGESKRISE